MRRLLALTVGLFVLLVPGVAGASCIVLPGERNDRLAAIAAGRTDADVAFAGRVVERRDAVERHGIVWTPLVFRVTATFKGAALKQRIVLINGGCIDDQCVSNSEELDFNGPRMQLVLADHRNRVGLVSASACSDAGPLTAAEVRLMLQPSTLPMTGVAAHWQASTGAACLFLGVALLVVGRRSARRVIA
jgi:hypothetical protein